MYMPLICPNYGGYLPFTSLLQEVSGLLYSTSTNFSSYFVGTFSGLKAVFQGSHI